MRANLWVDLSSRQAAKVSQTCSVFLESHHQAGELTDRNGVNLTPFVVKLTPYGMYGSMCGVSYQPLEKYALTGHCSKRECAGIC